MSKKLPLLLLSTIVAGLSIVAGLTLRVEPASATQPTPRSSEADFNPEDFSITLSPSTQALELKPNDTYESSVNVINSGKIPIDFTVKTTPFQVEANDGEYSADFASVNRYTELANWVKFDQTEYHIEPGETAEVEFRIDVPEKTVGGGQYAAIMIYTEDSADPSATIRTASQLAAILYGHVEGDDMKIEGTITEHNFPRLISSGPLKITASAQNTGNVDFALRHTVTIRNFFTNEEYFGPSSTESDGASSSIHEVVVMPDTSRTDTIVWENTPNIGLYRVEQTITVLDQTITEEKLILFCPLWILILIAVLIILLVFWIILAIVKRRRSRPQVL